MTAILTETPVSADKGRFLAISDYTMFDQTRPDGKHPVWVYYLSDSPNAIVVRIVLPSMDICEVTPQSKREVDIFTAQESHHLVRGSANGNSPRRLGKLPLSDISSWAGRNGVNTC
jgi:hypothetical protein